MDYELHNRQLMNKLHLVYVNIGVSDNVTESKSVGVTVI